MLVSLIGLPGGGKSTVGRQVARALQVRFIDLDTEIERQLGTTIRSYFESHGEESFRRIEAEALDAALGDVDAVLATGGGAVLRPENRRALKERSTVFFLRSTPEELFRRLRRDTQRPLLQVQDPLARLRQLHRERDPLYRETAHHVVEVARPSVPLLVTTVLMQLEMSGLAGAAPASAPTVDMTPESTALKLG